jgi:hypothetical protein
MTLDGQRFIVVQEVEHTSTNPLIVVINRLLLRRQLLRLRCLDLGALRSNPLSV